MTAEPIHSALLTLVQLLARKAAAEAASPDRIFAGPSLKELER